MERESGPRRPGVFGTLVRHFFSRFFDTESLSPQGEPEAGVIQTLGILAVPGAFFVLLFRPLTPTGWNLVAVRYMFVSFSMTVMGFLMVFEWDALFPDRRDYQLAQIYKSMKRILLLAIPLAVLTLLDQQGLAPRLTAESVSDLAMRNITGTFSSGRIADVAVDPRNRSVWYVATPSGGLWKTTNRGLNFQPIFDDGGSYSLGCVTVDPKNPDTVWLGTGENQAQRAIGYGDGIYKSTDAGKTWKNVGLPNSEHIGKIWVDPRNSNMV